jgi:hypothetical protein
MEQKNRLIDELIKFIFLLLSLIFIILTAEILHGLGVVLKEQVPVLVLGMFAIFFFVQLFLIKDKEEGLNEVKKENETKNKRY